MDRMTEKDLDVWAIIPVKSLLESKGRLAHLLSVNVRAHLVRKLLIHVLRTVQGTSRITRTLVVSTDPIVWEIAEAHGAEVVPENAPRGLNSAVSQVYALAMQAGADAVLILPTDLPFVTAADLELMLDSGLDEAGRGGLQIDMGLSVQDERKAVDGRPVMAICSDRRAEGTNGLVLRPLVAFDFHYGEQSLQKHIHEALDRDFAVRLVDAPGLQFDLDIEEDWRVLQDSSGGDLVSDSQVLRPSLDR